jgi:hypothetical protein
MAELAKKSAEWYLIFVAAVADVASIISFAGIQPSNQIRFAVVATLSLLGVLAGVFTLGSAISKRLSPRGSYYPGSYHRRKIAAGFTTLTIAVVLGAYLTMAAYHNKSGQLPTQEKPAPSIPAAPISH